MSASTSQLLEDAADLPFRTVDAARDRDIKAKLAAGDPASLRHVAAIAIGEAGRASIDGRYFEARHLDIVAAGLTELAAARTPSAQMAA